jgi:hypothetical protein
MSNPLDLGTLNTEQKIAIVRETRRVLGRGGKNWAKGAWYAVKRRVTPYESEPYDTFDPVPLNLATCFCLEGAINKAILNLGLAPYSQVARWRTVPARVVSLKAVVKRWGFNRVNQFNDFYDTTWEDVRKVLNTREAELVEQLEKEKA